MSQKRKRGLQRGLSEIIEKQTAPIEDKSKLSRGLIGKFADAPIEQVTPATHSTQGSQPDKTAVSVAPTRDFMKVANSIGRVAVPAGMFKGKSKQIYDYLYSKTRGAIVPVRSVQLTRRQIMKGAHVGSDKTIRENLLHLRAQQLITWDDAEHRGEHSGNVYTVFLPEEAQSTLATQTTQGTQGSPGHFLPSVPTVETTQGTQGISVDNADTSEDRKTSFKTKEGKTDDEPAALAPLRELERELTGKESSPANWKPLFELLIAEARIAAARTGQVSSVPAFLTEHLRRRLWKEDKQATQSREAATQEKQAPEPANVKDCPDCGGAGYYYPDGYEKGVAKCKHVKLGEGT